MLFIWQNVQTTPDPLQKIPTSCCSTDLVDQVASGKGNSFYYSMIAEISVIEFSRVQTFEYNSISAIALDGIQAALGSFLRTLLEILLMVVFSWPKLTCLLHLNHNLVLVLRLHLLDEVLCNSLLFV